MRTTQLMIAFALCVIVAMSLNEFASAQQVAADSAPRIWTSGSFTTNATLLKLEDGVVHLKKTDGTVVRLAIDKLSAADQEFVKKRVDGDNKDNKVGTTKSGVAADTSELVVKSTRLCEDITKAYRGRDAGDKATIAVVEFSDLSGGVTDFGRLLSEELITTLFATGNYKVIERLLLNKAIAEHKLQLQGLVDPKSAKELGKILGVDAIVSGTVADVGDSIRVNARLISTETGEVLSVAATTFDKDNAINGLINGSGKTTRSGSGGSSSPLRNNTELFRLPFREDFSGFKQDEVTSWGKGAKVREGADGRNWLVPTTAGQQPIGLNVELPLNSEITFEYLAECQPGTRGHQVLSGISLVDETGAKFRIEWRMEYSGYGWRQRMMLPGVGDPAPDTFGYAAAAAGGGQLNDNEMGIIRILKRGDRIEVGRLIGNVSEFKKFTRFEIDLYKGPKTMMSVTNIKVGSLGTSTTGR
ncbi:MAG: hypothetical protein HYV60_00070 [Planctomycetia bacterium]|nr:hypothetical protein [Planctomycetia bacterium]